MFKLLRPEAILANGIPHCLFFNIDLRLSILYFWLRSHAPKLLCRPTSSSTASRLIQGKLSCLSRNPLRFDSVESGLAYREHLKFTDPKIFMRSAPPEFKKLKIFVLNLCLKIFDAILRNGGVLLFFELFFWSYQDRQRHSKFWLGGSVLRIDFWGATQKNPTFFSQSDKKLNTKPTFFIWYTSD